MSDAFISYSRLDKEFVGKLREALADKGQDVWIDWESIPASQAWWQEIQKGIARANNFVLIMSPNSMSSPICHMEIEYARELGKRIIPVVYADYDRKINLANMAERLATDEETATRDIWGTRQPHDIYDANLAAIKPINYFYFKSDADFSTRFEELFKVIDTDPLHKEKHTTLGLRAAEWNRRGRDASFLLLGSELTDAERWRDSSIGKDPPPTPLQLDYITASRKASNRRRNITISGVLIAAVALVFAVGASLVGVTAVNQVATATVAQGNALAQVATATVEQGKAQNAAVTATVAQGIAQQDARNARTEVAIAGVTLTAVPPILTGVASAVADARVEQLISVGFGDALIKLAANQPNIARQTVDKLVQIYPDKASAYLSRALIYTNLGQVDLALTDYGKSIDLNPSYLEAYYNRANTYYSLQKYDQALADYSHALQIDPTDASIYTNRGNVYRALERYAEALADYNQAIKLAPEDAIAYFNAGNVRVDLEQPDQALASYTKAIERDSQYEPAYVSRGNVYFAKQQFDEAVADYTHAIELQPDNGNIYFNRANAYFQLQKYDQALDDYNHAVDLNPRDATAIGKRGGTLLLLGQFENAISDLTKVLKLVPDNLDAYYLRGAAYYFKHQYAEALADWKQFETLGGTLTGEFAQYRLEAEAALTGTSSPSLTPISTATP